MAQTGPVDPVKLFVAVLWNDAGALESACALLRGRWGEFDFAGTDHPFDATHYYEAEMGADLKRRLLSFARLAAPESIVDAKLDCNAMEDTLACNGVRRVNLDIGYLDHNKIVLASAKHAGQKIHLGKGIYADLIARYRAGKYQPFEWTFPDFRDGRYDEELARIRTIYLEQLRAQRTNSAFSAPPP